MADGGDMVSAIRVAVPLVQDYARIAASLRPDEALQFAAFTGMSRYEPNILARALIATPGPAYALIDRNGEAVAIGGFERLREGVWDTWGIGTLEGWSKHWYAITRESRRQMEHVFNSGAHRIQIIAHASRTDAHAWYARGLRMQYEGVLRGYCANGDDAVVYAQVRGGAQ
ncbi:MAG: hypothetical protein ACREO8_06600 [Luteimonas sp.]